MNTINKLLPALKLQFNLEHPSYEECYAFGYECGLGEVGESENPFSMGTQQSEQWLEGWWAGFYKEEPIFDIMDYMVAHEMAVDFAANDEQYQKNSKKQFFTKVLEISSVIAVSAVIGYQVIDIVA